MPQKLDLLAFINMELTGEVFQEHIARAKQKLSHASPSAGLEELNAIESQLASGVLHASSLIPVLEQLVREPTEEDLQAALLLFGTGSAEIIGLSSSELCTGYDKRGLPFDTAISEARNIVSGIETKGGKKWLMEFLATTVGQSALRTMADYIDTHQAPIDWQDGWRAQQKRARSLRVFADALQAFNS